MLRRVLITVILFITQHYASSLVAKELSQQTNFACLDDILDLVPALGQGDKPEAFIPRDIENALKLQRADSELIVWSCTANAKATAVAKKVDGQDVLTTITINIPMSIVVKTANREIPLVIEQEYVVENLETLDRRKVENRLIVKK